MSCSQGRSAPLAPLLIFGALSCVAGALALLLPETLHADLPQTLQEGEDFCKTFKFCHFPCQTRYLFIRVGYYFQPNLNYE